MSMRAVVRLNFHPMAGNDFIHCVRLKEKQEKNKINLLPA
jgi:hypothetical protein